jgi:hypothetical protein
MRFIDHKLVIRLNKKLTPEQIATLEDEFPELLKDNEHIICCDMFPEEADEPDLADLARIYLHFDHHHYGLLLAFIHRINTF